MSICQTPGEGSLNFRGNYDFPPQICLKLCKLKTENKLILLRETRDQIHLSLAGTSRETRLLFSPGQYF